MRNGIVTTVAGWVATEPREIVEGGSAWTSFRLGVTPRRRDPVTSGWVDGRTEWVTVKAWRELAKNLVESVSKGQPLVVHGRLEVDEWTTSEGAVRRELALHAWHVGHDLTHGRATFVRRVHVDRAETDSGAPVAAPSEPGEIPADAWTTVPPDAAALVEPEAADLVEPEAADLVEAEPDAESVQVVG